MSHPDPQYDPTDIPSRRAEPEAEADHPSASEAAYERYLQTISDVMEAIIRPKAGSQ